MFDAYKVAVRITLNNEVSRGLLLIVKDFSKAEMAASAFQRRVNSIKSTLLKGVGMFGGSAAIAAPFIFAIDKAAELQKQMLAIQVATRGTTADMNSMREAIEGIAAQTVFSNIDVARMGKLVATGTGLDAKSVQALLPQYARFADVQYIMKGTPYQQSVTDAVRLAHTAQHYDPQSLAHYMDLLTKASLIIPGGIGEVGQALKYSQGIAKTALGVNDDQMILLTALLNRLGFAGSRGGTNLIAAMTRTIPGIFGSGLLTGKSNEALRAMNMVDSKGHSVFLKNGKFDVVGWMGGLSEYVAREMARHPEGVARQLIMMNFQHAFGRQGSRIAALLSDPQALKQWAMIGRTFQELGGTQSIQQFFANQAVAQQWQNAKTNFISAMTELGTTLLPLATVWLKKFNTEMLALIKCMSNNQGTVKVLAYAFLSLSGAMAFGGTVLLLSAGFKGLALAFSVLGGKTAMLKVSELVFTLTTAFSEFIIPLTVVAGIVGGLAYLWTHKKETKKAYSDWWQGGMADDDPTAAAIESRYVKPGHAAAQKPIVLTVDGRVLGQVTSAHQAKQAAKPQASSSAFDPRQHMVPVGVR